MWIMKNNSIIEKPLSRNGRRSGTTNPLPLAEYLKDCCLGIDNAMPMDKVASVFNISRRELRALVAQANEMLIPILFSSASNGGIFYALKQEELAEFIEREISHRIIALNKRKDALQKIRIIEQQPVLTGKKFVENQGEMFPLQIQKSNY